MRILMIAPEPFLRPRGTPFSVHQRICALSRLGHAVDLVTYPFGESPAIPGLAYHRAARPPLIRDAPVGPSISKAILDLPLFLRSRRLAAGGGYDLIHTHEEAGAFGASLARRARCRHLYDMHSSLPAQFESFGRYNWRPVVAFFRRLERYTLRRADGVITICRDLYDHVRASGYGGPLALIENTLEVEAPEIRDEEVLPLRRSLGPPGPCIVYTGTFEAYQGLDLLIQAVPRVIARHPAARFVLVGGAPDQIDLLRGLAEREGGAGAVTFVPAVPSRRIAIYHRLADILITTRTRGTNTPLKVYQYMRAGRPIVATAVRSHTQVLDGETAALVAPAPAAIAEGISRLIADPALAAGLAEAAGRRARERYSEEGYLAKLRDLLERITAGEAGDRRRAGARAMAPP